MLITLCCAAIISCFTSTSTSSPWFVQSATFNKSYFTKNFIPSTLLGKHFSCLQSLDLKCSSKSYYGESEQLKSYKSPLDTQRRSRGTVFITAISQQPFFFKKYKKRLSYILKTLNILYTEVQVQYIYTIIRTVSSICWTDCPPNTETL